MKSLRGQFLVASPHLPDPSFARTVILMVEHHAGGALGLVLNRPAGARVGDLLKDDHGCSGDSTFDDCRLLLGGPCDGQIMCLHGCANFSEGEVLSGVHLATQSDHLLNIVHQDNASFRIFWGYAGWGEGQLESEMDLGGWLTTPATAELVFEEDVDSLWQLAVTRSGQQILREALNIRNFPADAGLN